MNEMNVDWDDLRLFLAVARGGGLAAAKASTGKSAPTLGRRMLALERRLGLELFERLPRGYALTQDGARFLEKVQALADHLDSLIRPQHDRSKPLVKISAGTWVTTHLCRHMSEIVSGVEARLRFIAADAVSDIGRREALVGIRNAPPTDTALAGRRIGLVRFAVYAVSPEIKTWARVTGTTPSARWVAAQSDGSSAIEISHPRNALDLALTGQARAVMPTFIGDSTPGVMRIGDPIEPLDHEQWLVMHHEDRHLPPVRTVITRLYGVLKTACSKA